MNEGRVFQSLTVDGKKEFRYLFVLAVSWINLYSWPLVGNADLVRWSWGTVIILLRILYNISTLAWCLLVSSVGH